MRIKTAVILGLCVCLAYATSLVAGDRAAYSATRLPGVRVLGSLSEQYAPVTFDHPKHVAIAGSCAACHHHGNGNTSSCRECHALSPSVFKSSVVHSFMPCSNWRKKRASAMFLSTAYSTDAIPRRKAVQVTLRNLRKR